MAITSVRVSLNGTWHNLSYNSGTSKWEGTLTAPGQTSYNLAGGYFPITIEASNTAGTTAVADASDSEIGTSLRLVVRETIPPIIAVNSPTDGAFISNNQQPIIFTVTDESGGSGVNVNSLNVTLDGTKLSGIQTTAVTNGYSCTVTPPAMSDGSHTITINATDNDGNAAIQKTVIITVDTVPPTLNVTSPSEKFITSNSSITVQGTTNDATSSPVTVAITLNGTDCGAITVDANGGFSKTVSLIEGSNAISVTATDKAGKTTTVNRTVILDTTEPNIKSISVNPNPTNVGATVIISVVVE